MTGEVEPERNSEMSRPQRLLHDLGSVGRVQDGVRQIVTSNEFDAQVRFYFDDERSATGRPSRSDFMAIDVSSAFDQLATDYERVTMPHNGGRIMITHGVLVGSFALRTHELTDGSVLVYWLDLDQS